MHFLMSFYHFTSTLLREVLLNPKETTEIMTAIKADAAPTQVIGCIVLPVQPLQY